MTTEFDPSRDDPNPLVTAVEGMSMDDIAAYLTQQAKEAIGGGADPKMVQDALKERLDTAREAYYKYGPDIFGSKTNYNLPKPDVAGLEGITTSPGLKGVYGDDPTLSDPALIEGSNTKNVLTDPLLQAKDWSGKLTDMNGLTPDAPRGIVGNALHTYVDAAKQVAMNYTPIGLVPMMAGKALGFAAGAGEYLGTGDYQKALETAKQIETPVTETLSADEPDTALGKAWAAPMQSVMGAVDKYGPKAIQTLGGAFGLDIGDNEAQLAADIGVPSAIVLAGGKGLKEAVKPRKGLSDVFDKDAGLPERPKSADPSIDTGFKIAGNIYKFSDVPIQGDLFDTTGESSTRDMFSGEVGDASIAERDRQIAKNARTSYYDPEDTTPQRMSIEDEANQDLFKNQPIVPGMPLTRGHALTEPVVRPDTAPEQGELSLAPKAQGELFSQNEAPIQPKVPEPVVTRGDAAARQPAKVEPVQAKSEEPSVQAGSAEQEPNVTMSQVQGTPGLFAPAYHTSPHEFNQFSTDKIGTGQGAQSFGWGLYFASEKAVADAYKKSLGGRPRLDGKMSVDYPTGSPEAAALRKISAHGGLAEAIAQIQKQIGWTASDIKLLKNNPDWINNPKDVADLKQLQDQQVAQFKIGQVLDQITEGKRKLKMPPPNKGYSVDLAPEEHEYLDWDKPLAKQSDHVQNALRNLFGRDISKNYFRPEEVTGESIYRDLQGRVLDSGMKVKNNSDVARQASKLLADNGIRGIRYLDGGSRASGEGTSNYVLFNDKDVKITGRFAPKTNQAVSGLSRGVWEALDRGELTGGHILDAIADNHENLFGDWPFGKSGKEVQGFAGELRNTAERLGIGQDTKVSLMDPNNPEHAEALQRLQDSLKSKGEELKGKDWAGFYDPVSKQVFINGEHNFTYHSALHEVAHAITHQALELGREGKLTGKAGQAYGRLSVLFNALKEKAPHLNDEYGFTNLHEMMSEMFSNPDFRDALRKVKLDAFDQGKMDMSRKAVGLIRNAYEAVVKGVKDILGLSPKAETALDALFSSSKEFLSTYDPRDAKPVRGEPVAAKAARTGPYEASLSPRRAVQNLDETRRGGELRVSELGINPATELAEAAAKEKVPNQALDSYLNSSNPNALNSFPETKKAADAWTNQTRVPLANQGTREQLQAGNQKAANAAYARGTGELASAYQGPKFARQMYKLADQGAKIQAAGGALESKHVDAMQKLKDLTDYAKSQLYPQGMPATADAQVALDRYTKQLVGLRDTILTNLPGMKHIGMVEDLSGKASNHVRQLIANGNLGRGFSNVPPAVEEALGKTHDAIANVLNHTLRQGLDITRTRFQNAVLETGTQAGWIKDAGTAGKGWVDLTGSHWGPLEDKAVPKKVKSYLQNIHDSGFDLQKVMDGMLKPQNAGAITKAIGGAALDAWMGAVQNLKGFRLLTDGGYYTMYLLGSLGKLASAGNLNLPAMYRGIKETFNEFRSGVTSADHAELVRNGLIDYSASNILRRRITAGQFSNTLEMNPIRESLEGYGVKNAIHNTGSRIEGVLGAMDYWATKANYFARKGQLTDFYERNGIKRSAEDIEREAADQTKQTNTTPGRGLALGRMMERTGASISLPYVLELHRNVVNSVKLVREDLTRAYDAKDWRFAEQAIRRFTGTVLAVTAGDFMYQQLGQMWANSLGITSSPIAEDDKRTPYLQDEGSRFRAGKASQLRDASTDADKQNVYMWDPGGAWDQFYAVSQELRGLGELAAHWDDPNYDVKRQVGRIADNFTAIIGTNNVTRTALKIWNGTASAQAKRDPEGYKAQMSQLQELGLSEQNANRAENLKEIVTPGIWKKYQNTKGLSTGMQVLAQAGYGVTKMPADAGLGGYETTKFNNAIEKARTSITSTMTDDVNYSDATLERRYVKALKDTNDALQQLRDAADFGRGNNMDDTDLSINAMAKSMNAKAAGTLGNISAAEMLYRDVSGGIEKQATLLRDDESKADAFTEAAMKKLEKFQEFTEKYMDLTPKQIKELK